MEVLGAHYGPSVVARSQRRRQPQALQVGSYLLSQHPPSPVLQHVVPPPCNTHDRLPTRMHMSKQGSSGELREAGGRAPGETRAQVTGWKRERKDGVVGRVLSKQKTVGENGIEGSGEGGNL